jgi:hypothetical protein
VAHKWRPGMQFYEIIWMRDGEEIYRCSRHAANEADAIAAGERDFAKHIKARVQGDLEGTTVEVRPVHR